MEGRVTSATNEGERVAGGVLAAASVLSIVVMAHHPTGPGHSTLNELVHGSMMALVVLIAAGYARHAAQRGLRRFSILAALLAYGAGAVANLLAATINGFAAPAAFEAGISRDVLRLYWELNQALANAGVYATSFAFLIWGLDLMRERGLRRLVGVLGLAAGAIPVALLASGALSMNVSGALVIYALHALFGVVVGADMMRARPAS